MNFDWPLRPPTSAWALMITDKIAQLAQLKATVRALEEEVSAEQRGELAGLPARYGFGNVAEFIAAVRAATGKRGRRKLGQAKPAVNAVRASGSKRRRAKITANTRAKVKQLVAAKKTGGAIAEALGISIQSVHNIKKALGLVKKSGK